jgi:hypothetical protein
MSEARHKNEYESIIRAEGVVAPKWEDLSEDRREAIRIENRRWWAELETILNESFGRKS